MSTKPNKEQTEPKFKETEIGLIPEDWEVVKIKELGKVITGKTPPTKEKDYFGSDYPFIKIPDIGDSVYINKTKTMLSKKGAEYMNSLKIPKDSVLISCLATIGKVGITTRDSFTNQQINSLICDRNKVIPPWVYYYFKINTSYLESLGGGGSIYTNISKSKFENALIPLPPLPEQKRIAYVLSTIQNAREKTENVINSLKEFKKSMMKHLFTYGPVSLEEAEKVKLKETEIGRIPEHWEVVKVSDFAITKAGGTPSTLENRYWNGDVPWINSGELHNCYINKPTKYITKLGLKNSAAKLLPANTVVIALTGATTGMVGFLTFECSTNQSVVGILPNKKFNELYLFYHLIYSRERVLSFATGAAQPHINKAVVDNLLVSLPPLPEQQQIASILSAIDSRIEAEEAKKKALDELFKSMLHNLMTGKIRVKDLTLKEV